MLLRFLVKLYNFCQNFSNFRICCDAKVALKGITIPSYLITARGIGNLHYQYLGVNISVNSGDNTWIQNCLPLVNSTDGTHYQINIVPPVKLSSRSQPTFLTVEIRQLPGYQNYVRINY